MYLKTNKQKKAIQLNLVLLNREKKIFPQIIIYCTHTYRLTLAPHARISLSVLAMVCAGTTE